MDDLISRQAMIDAVKKELNKTDQSDAEKTLNLFYWQVLICSVPSAEPTIEVKPDPELEYRKAKAPVFITHRYIDEETGKEGTWTSVHCPVCFNNEKVRLWNSLISRDTAFCSRCGQKIKWKVEK